MSDSHRSRKITPLTGQHRQRAQRQPVRHHTLSLCKRPVVGGQATSRPTRAREGAAGIASPGPASSSGAPGSSSPANIWPRRSTALRGQRLERAVRDCSRTLPVLAYLLGMPARKRPTADNTVTARRILLDGLTRDADLFDLAGELAPLHPRN